MSAFLLPNAGWGQQPNRVRHGRLVYTYKRAVCVCWSAFYRPHDICPLYGAASEYSESSQAVAGGPARAAGNHAHSESTRAHAVQLLNVKIAALMPFKNKTVRARAHAVVYVTAEIFKKKTNMPLPKFSLQFAFSWSVYFSNRTESYSSQIEFAGPHGITENQATYLHCGGEARAKKRARPPATCRKASTAKTGADTGPEGCGAPAVFPSPCLGDGGRDGGKEGCGAPALFPSPCSPDTGRNGGKERHQSPEDGRDKSR